jgi:integrase
VDTLIAPGSRLAARRFCAGLERWAAFANIECCSAAALIRSPYRYAARRAAGGPPRQSPPLSGAALIISKWAGHYDSSFTMKTYVHASDEDLKQGSQALAKIHRIG